MTTESYLFICKQVGLDINELDFLTVGGAIDYAEEYVSELSTDTSKKRRASQADFDNF